MIGVLNSYAFKCSIQKFQKALQQDRESRCANAMTVIPPKEFEAIAYAAEGRALGDVYSELVKFVESE